jgi:hypothetical protein
MFQRQTSKNTSPSYQRLHNAQKSKLKKFIVVIFQYYYAMLVKASSEAKSLSKRANDYSSNMSAATPTAFLVFYRFKAMSDQEAQKSSVEWNDLKKSLPSDVRLAGEYNHAWGTEYNGFLLFEADNTNSFLDWWSSFKDKIRWYVDQTHTIVARRRT